MNINKLLNLKQEIQAREETAISARAIWKTNAAIVKKASQEISQLQKELLEAITI